MHIQEVERRTGLTRANIRYYEREGLLDPGRLENGYRDYREEDVAELLRIKLLRELGFSLAAIGRVQRGEEPLSREVECRLRELDGEQGRLRSAQAVCARLREDRVEYATLEAKPYLDAFYAGPAVSRTVEADVTPPDPHPWRRYFARWVDERLYILLLTFLWCIPFHHMDTKAVATVTGFLVPAAMLLIEPLFLHFLGTTPGKWLLGISLRTAEGGKLSLGQAYYRTWCVLWQGNGLYIPILSLYCNYRCYRREMEGVPQPWDEEDEHQLLYAERAWPRYLALAGTAAAWLGAIVWIAEASRLPPNRGDLTVEEFCENYNWYSAQLGVGETWRLERDGSWSANLPDDVIIFPEPQSPENLAFTEENGLVTAISGEMWYEETCTEKAGSSSVISNQQGNLGQSQQLLTAMALVGARAGVFSEDLEAVAAWGESFSGGQREISGVSLERELTLDGFELYADNMLLCGREGTNRAEMTFSITIVK